MNLFALQQAFIAQLENQPVKITDYIPANSRLSAQAQFAIYKNSIQSRLQNTLKKIYPVCYKLVGEDFFLYMTKNFIQQTPSHYHDLNQYGESFPAFIQTYSLASTLPYLSDVAKLEWAWHRLHGAPDTTEFDFEAFAEDSVVAGELIQFTLPSRSTLVTSPYPIYEIWLANQESASEQIISLRENQQFYLFIWHRKFNMHISPLLFAEWKILSWVQENLSLGSLIKRVELLLPQINLSLLLPKFIASGWIENFVLCDPNNH